MPARQPKKDELIEFILNERGIGDTETFLNPSLDHIHDPFLIHGMKEVAESIIDAVEKKKKIVIHGDFDVDGVTGTSIMFDFLYREMGAEVTPIIPNRFTDGYGISEETLKRAKKQNAEVVITVDCGIKDVEIVEKYKNKFDFIITDHHSLLSSTEYPEEKHIKVIGDHAVAKGARAVTHPGLGGSYPFRDICGAVVSWKVCMAVNELAGLNVNMYKYLGLAMMGTVCDIMPLRDENRAIVKFGLEKIRGTENPGLKALMDVSGINPKDLQSYQIGYVLGPRLNAAGRIDHALDAVRLLTTNSPKTAGTIARKLDDLNKERQDLTQEYSDKADEIVKAEGNKKVYFIVGEDWPEGIIGLIAGKLTQKHNRPVLVASKTGKHLKGSARSIPTFNIANAFKALDKHLIRHGGHAGAAGFQLDYSTLFDFKEDLENHVNENLTDQDLEKLLFIDSKVHINDIDFNVLEELFKLEPFGQNNPDPVFAFMDLFPNRVERFGSDSQHIKAYVPERPDIEFIGFNNADRYYPLLSSGSKIHIAGFPGINEWNGRKRLQIKISDVTNE